MSNERLQKWALIAEIIGGIAIVMSLIFVGYEVRNSAAETRQAAEVTRAATVLQLKQAWVDFNLMQAANPELGRVYDLRNEVGYENLNPKDRLLFTAQLRAILHNLSNAYYQYRVGTLEQEQWDPLQRDIDDMASDPSFWSVWDNWNHIYDDPFRDLVNAGRPKE
jgi:hypothetical protein